MEDRLAGPEWLAGTDESLAGKVEHLARRNVSLTERVELLERLVKKITATDGRPAG